MGSTLAGLLQGIFAQQPAAIPVASSGGGGVVQNPVIQTPTNSGKTALLTPGDSNIRLLTPGSNAYVIPSQSSYPLGAAVSTSYGPAHQVSQDGQTLNLLDRNYTVI
jgi:hypothetical protein